jgi:hypothetical protein
MPTLAEEFAQFYKSYPRRVARMDAEKAYTQIRKRGIHHEHIMAGVERYLAHLPDEACFIPYPASWLRAGRFDDEYEVRVPAKQTRADCQHTPSCHSLVWCAVLQARERGEVA